MTTAEDRQHTLRLVQLVRAGRARDRLSDVHAFLSALTDTAERNLSQRRVRDAMDSLDALIRAPDPSFDSWLETWVPK